MITLVGRWESGWLGADVEHFMFRQLKGAFKFDRLVMVPKDKKYTSGSVDQYDTMEEALESCKGRRFFLEPTGTTLLDDMPHEEDAVYIFGNASRHNLTHVKDDDLTIRIPTPGNADMFAVNAAAIVLANIE